MFRFDDNDINQTPQHPTREAMGLAGMNPVCGVAGNGAFLVNVMNHDKDLEVGWKDYKAVSRSLDPNDSLYGIDANGRILAKNKDYFMDKPDVVVEAYIIKSDNVDEVMSKIEEEANLPYDQRPTHKPDYLYEAFTGKRLLSESQLEFDPLLEKVELPTMSGVVAGEYPNTNQLSGPASLDKPDHTDFMPEVDNLNGMVENSLLDIDPLNILEAIDRVQTVEPYKKEVKENTLDMDTFSFNEDSQSLKEEYTEDIKTITEDLDTLAKTKNNLDKFFTNARVRMTDPANMDSEKQFSFDDDNIDLDELEPKYAEPFIKPKERFSFDDI